MATVRPAINRETGMIRMVPPPPPPPPPAVNQFGRPIVFDRLPILRMPEPEVYRMDVEDNPVMPARRERILAEDFFALEEKVARLEKLVEQLVKESRGINITEHL